MAGKSQSPTLDSLARELGVEPRVIRDALVYVVASVPSLNRFAIKMREKRQADLDKATTPKDE